MKSFKRRLLFPLMFCSTILSSMIAAEGTMPADQSHFFGHLGFGAGVTNMNNYTQDIWLANGLMNRYINNNTTQLAFEFSAGLGYRAVMTNKLDVEVLMNAYMWRFGNSGGTVKPFYNASPNFDTLDYSYNLDPVFAGMLETHFVWKLSNYQPYLLVGAGVAYNSIYGYTEATPQGSTASPTLFPFRDNSWLRLAFTLGFGVECHWKHTSWVSFGYQYANANRAQLNTTSVQISNTQLQSPVLQAHMLTVSFGFEG